MKKRMLAMLLVLVLVLAMLPLHAMAQERASNYLSFYRASAYAGSASGQIKLNFSVTATDTMKQVGVQKVQLYRASNDSLYKTSWGTTSNGLMFANTAFANGTYTMTGISGETYYCKVTIYASNASGWDSRTITTGTVTAP